MTGSSSTVWGPASFRSTVMEFCDGGNLLDHLTGRSRGVHFTLMVTTSIGSALSYMHAQGVVHRDVKPETILMKYDQESEAEQVKLADFGQAQAIGQAQLRRSVRVAGPLKYMSPESLEGIAKALVAIWALGRVAVDCAKAPRG